MLEYSETLSLTFIKVIKFNEDISIVSARIILYAGGRRDVLRWCSTQDMTFIHQDCCPVWMFRTVQCPNFLVESSCIAPAFSDVLSSKCILVVQRCVVNLVSLMQLRRFCLFICTCVLLITLLCRKILKYK